MPPAPPGFDSSGVSPADAVVTIRSLRRRFGEVFDQAEGTDAVVGPPAGGGLSALEHAAWTAQALEAVRSAVRQVVLSLNPPVDPPPVDPASSVLRGGETPASVLARLGDIARSVADSMAEVHGQDWSRTGQAATGEVSALDIARLGVRIGVEHLRASEQAIRATTA